MESILITIKKLLGITEEYEQFDIDIITHVNSVLAILTQMGILKTTKCITNKENTWSELNVSEDNKAMIISYVYMKVKMMWDPPQGSMNDVMDRQMKELEWRMFDNSDSESETTNE